MGEKKEREVLLAALFFAVCVVILKFCLQLAVKNSLLLTACLGLLLLVAVLGCAACVDVWRLGPADSHTLSSLLSQYWAVNWLRFQAPFIRRMVADMASRPREVNRETLLRIIRMNEHTEYGQKYNFSEIKSPEDFQKIHPVTKYDHYRDEIIRIRAGGQNLLHPEPTCYLALTSGTTGGPKLYPFCPSFLKRYRFIVQSVSPTYNLLPTLTMKRYLRFNTYGLQWNSPGSIPMGGSSQVTVQCPHHELMPEKYKELHTEDASFYAMGVFALAERELSEILGFSAYLMLAFMKFIIKHWGSICQDIEHGQIGRSVEMPEDVRFELSKHLKADRSRAEYLREVIKDGVVGLAKRTWPHFAVMTMGKSAGFKMLATKLMEKHFKGLKVVDPIHGASEGVLGLNMEEEEDRVGQQEEDVFTLYPSFCFYEFIPLAEVDGDNPRIVQIDQLEVGHEYEIVITTENGLYRYRFGDIIRVVGYKNKLPKYKFAFKLGQRLSVALERTTESLLLQALSRSASDLDVEVCDFTTTESTNIEDLTGDSTKCHYVYFIECGDKLEAVTEIGKRVDRYLIDHFGDYKIFKERGSIGDVEVIQVKPGTMAGLKSVITGGKTNTQFKMPRVIRVEAALRHLLHNRMLH